MANGINYDGFYGKINLQIEDEVRAYVNNQGLYVSGNFYLNNQDLPTIIASASHQPITLSTASYGLSLGSGLNSQVLTLSSASTTTNGVVITGSQEFMGPKTFYAGVTLRESDFIISSSFFGGTRAEIQVETMFSNSIGYTFIGPQSNNFSFGELVTLDPSNGYLMRASAASGSVTEVLGVALQDDTFAPFPGGPAPKRVATLIGSLAPVLLDTTPSIYEIGKPVYASSLYSGKGSLTPPSGSGDRIFKLGILTTATVGISGSYKVLLQPQLIADLL